MQHKTLSEWINEYPSDKPKTGTTKTKPKIFICSSYHALLLGCSIKLKHFAPIEAKNWHQNTSFSKLIKRKENLRKDILYFQFHHAPSQKFSFKESTNRTWFQKNFESVWFHEEYTQSFEGCVCYSSRSTVWLMAWFPYFSFAGCSPLSYPFAEKVFVIGTVLIWFFCCQFTHSSSVSW